MTKYLVTGATGFVGACLTRNLVQNGHQVTIISRNIKPNWRLEDISSQLQFINIDLLDPTLPDVLKEHEFDYIYHLAAYGASSKESDVNMMIDSNIKGTINFYNAVKDHAIKLFINTGSSSEYGITEKVMEENDIIEPINDYGISKASATLFCQKEGIRTGFPIITLRLFSPFGYFESPERLIPTVIVNALQGRPIHLSSPENVRDFIFIEDVLRAYTEINEQMIKPGSIYNVGSGEQYSSQFVVDTILKLTGSSSKVLWNTAQRQERQIEPVKWQASIEKMKHTFNWRPSVTFEEAMDKNIRWFKDNLHLYNK